MHLSTLLRSRASEGSSDLVRRLSWTFCARVALAIVVSILGLAQKASGTWIEQVANSPQILRVVHAVNNEIAWAVGNSGQVVGTIDGGSNWESRPVPGAVNLRGLFAFDGETSVVADQMGRFWRTTNGGVDWIQVFGGTGRSINGIHFFDSENGWAMGDPVGGFFVILESTDGGWSWTASPNAPPASEGMIGTVRSYDWVGTQIGLFTTTQWVIWRTTNGGAAWDSVRTGIQFLNGSELSNTGIGLASGNNLEAGPFLERSTDFGLTWSPGQHPPNANQLRNFDWIEGTSEVWGATNQTGVYQSTNEGVDWIQYVLAPPNEFQAGDLDFVDGNTGWCVGHRSSFGPGRIFKYSSTTGITIVPAAGAPAKAWTQPNPFSADVEFALEAREEPIEISVYDVRGRKLWTHGVLWPGIGEYRWDGRDSEGHAVASGLYLYRVRTATTEINGRLLKVR